MEIAYSNYRQRALAIKLVYIYIFSQLTCRSLTQYSFGGKTRASESLYRCRLRTNIPKTFRRLTIVYYNYLMAIPQEAEHIYLEVVHIQSGPLPADKGKLNGASPFTGIEQGSPKRSCSSLNIVLAAMVVILGVLCCLFLVLYVTEKAQSCEDAGFETRHSTSSKKPN